MILGIDHILIAVEDLALATEVYEKLGFQVLAGGTHPKMGTHNALVPLADGTYLELIGVWDASLAEQFSHPVLAALQSNNRLAGFALSSDNLEADIAEIRARGFEISDPREGERERPDGQRIQWRTAFPTDARFPFLIQDVTPRDLRISEPTAGIGQTLHINDVNVGVIDVPTAQAQYEKLLGISGEDGWFEMQRGAIILKDVNTERVLQIVLEADNPLEVVNAFNGGNVEYTEQVIGGMGISLQPLNTLGAPIQITGRVS